MTPVDYALGGVGALSSIIGTGMSNSTNKKIARENRAWSEAMWDKQSAWQEQMVGQQQDWQEMMWNKENEYNTASAQIQRLIDAGINPNNAAGLVSNGAAGMPSAPSVPMPASMPIQNPIPSQPYDISGGLRLAADMSMMEKEKEKLGSDIMLNAATVKKIMRGDIPKAEAETLQAMSQAELNEALSTQVTLGNSVFYNMTDAQLYEAAVRINKMIFETKGQDISNQTAAWTLEHMLPLQEKLENDKIRLVLSEIKKNYAEAKAALAQANRDNAEAGFINVQTQQLSAQTGAVQQEAELRKVKATQSIAQLNKLGVTIDESGYDDLTKIVLHIQNAQNCSFDEAADKAIEILDGSAKYGAYYIRQQLNRKYASGNATNADYVVGSSFYGTDKVMGRQKEYNFGRSKGDWNPRGYHYDDYHDLINQGQ